MIEIPLRNRSGEVVAFALVDDVDADQARHRWSLERTATEGEARDRIRALRTVLMPYSIEAREAT